MCDIYFTECPICSDNYEIFFVNYCPTKKHVIIRHLDLGETPDFSAFLPCSNAILGGCPAHAASRLRFDPAVACTEPVAAETEGANGEEN